MVYGTYNYSYWAYKQTYNWGAHIVYIHINMYAQATQLDLQRQDMQILWQLVKCAATFSFMFNSVWFGVVFFTVL